jgi:hypothetical protein
MLGTVQGRFIEVSRKGTVRFDFLTAVLLKIQVFWDMMLCCQVNRAAYPMTQHHLLEDLRLQ